MLLVAVCCGQFSVITIHVILCSGDDGEDVVASMMGMFPFFAAMFLG
jgi:hypothetical protein